MASTKPPQGLLSKIALLFGEADRETAPSDDDSQLPNLKDEVKAQKERAKRKKREDSIRRREFNQLRPLLKKRQNLPPNTHRNGTSRPPIFRSSANMGQDDRAETLKKIQFIEAHVVQSWNNSRIAQKTGLQPPSEAPLVTLTDVVQVPAAQHTVADDLDLDFTQEHLETTAPTPLDMVTAASEEPEASGYSMQASVQEEDDLNALENTMRDAAILFSDGDIPATESQLLNALQMGNLEADLTDALVSALCDVYRYSGQQDKFNATAMEHAEQFGRSPPEWFSLPELLAQRKNTKRRDVFWESPAQLDGQAVTLLEQTGADASMRLHIDWTPLQELASDAAPDLARLLACWCAQPVELHWRGTDALLAALQAREPSTDQPAEPLWWHVHMDALCILGLQDAFDELALDYCTVFEVSPPSWKQARCTFTESTPSGTTNGHADVPDSLHGALPREHEQHRNFALVGDLVGEFSPQLEQLAGASAFADHVCIQCAHIGRVDFAAAGSILNLVLQNKASGSTMQFVQVPRLVGIFFKMLAIDRHAQILISSQ